MLDALGQAALRTLLLAALVHLVLFVFHVRRAQLLLAAWIVVLGASLLMPALQWAAPIRLPIVPPSARTLLPDAASGLQPFSPEPRPLQGVAPQQPSLPAVEERSVAPLPWLDVIYLLVLGALLLRLSVGVALSLWLLHRASPLTLDGAGGDRIRISQDLATPVTVANVILLPPDAVDWLPAMRQAVLAHERAHVARWDFAILLLAQLNRAVFWFNPLSWWLLRRLTALTELASDDQALATIGDRIGYAEILLEMGSRPGPLARGVAMARRATLQYRIERLLLNEAGGNPVGRVQQAMLAIGAAGLSILAACPQPGFAPPGATAVEQPSEPEAGSQLDATPAPQAFASQQPEAISRSYDTEGPVLPSPGEVMGGASPRVPRGASGSDPAPAGLPRAASLPDAAEAPSARQPAIRHPAPVAARKLDLLKLIDRQSCSGVYLPGPAGPHEGDWLNMISAKFHRTSGNSAWMWLSLGNRTPVHLRVTVKGSEVEFTTGLNTVFTMLPRGSNHLTGTTQRPYGTVDFTCGSPNAHLFDKED